MKKVAIMLADGFEEIEAITPKDVFSRAGIECDLISIKENVEVIGSHDVKLRANKILNEDEDLHEYSMIVLPGGLPGAKYLSENEKLLNILRQFDKEHKYIAAICASPALILPKAGIEKGRKVTSYPGMEDHLSHATYINDLVVQDDNLITSRGPATALEFSYKLVDILVGSSEKIQNGMLYNYIKQ